MQVTETSVEGLKRQLRVVVGAEEIGERFKARLDEIKDRVQLKGFRKGKVPEQHLKRIYGRSLMAEVVQQTVDETSRQAITERKERPALTPKIELPQDSDEIERILSGQSDLSFDMSFEVLPEINVADFAGLKLTRLVADVEDGAIDKAIADLAERNVRYEVEADRVAERGDRVTIDFVGKIDGAPLENGSGEGATLVLGQGGSVPGFEDGLVGAKAGEDRVLNLTFPAEYPVEKLKGKEATFEVKVKEVARPVKPAIDDEFARGLGAQSLAKLREMVAAQLKRDYDAISRQHLKRALLDELDKAHDFALPQTLVDGEFEAIWAQANKALERAGRTLADEGKSEEAARSEYRKLAERRVRLGLVLGEIGERNKIQVTQDELRRALIERARSFPGQERAVYEYYERTPQALVELRAPIFEDKVVDFIVELAKPEERKVSIEELVKASAAESPPAAASEHL
ncbi:MAG TPA: trigger factor [Hyphomicrobiaceae bacterium]|nr:trigger factor [Hyphomicrobiaceae bacterium]